MQTRKERWIDNYNQLRQYVAEHKQFPDKKKVENRRLLNWWKYNRKCIKEGKMEEEKVLLLNELSAMRLIHK